ncbi:lasso peptide biosynthesis B2 protein [Sphingobium chungangianum]
MIFLDVPRDRYFALSSSAAELLARMVGGVAVPRDIAGTPLEALLEKSKEPASIAPFVLQVPSNMIDASASTCSARDLAAVCHAHVDAYARLRIQPLHRILRALKPELPRFDRSADVASLVAAFRKSDAVISRQDRCLWKGLALVLYLRRKGVRARLVFGVAARPFHAHCWVQTDEALLIDEPDVVAGFVPILSAP